MIPNAEEGYYPAEKQLSALLRGIMSKHLGDYCLNFVHLFGTKKPLKIKILVLF